MKYISRKYAITNYEKDTCPNVQYDFYNINSWTYCGLLTPYGDIDLGQ